MDKIKQALRVVAKICFVERNKDFATNSNFKFPYHFFKNLITLLLNVRIR